MKKYGIYLLLVCVMLFWGVNITATKVLVAHFSPLTMTSFRIFTASVGALGILHLLKLVRKPTVEELRYILIGTLFNVVMHHSLLALGLTKTSASNGGIIIGLGPILTTALTIILLKDRVTILRLLGVFLGFAGVALTVIVGSGGIRGVSIGDLLVFLSILSQALSFIIIKKATKTLDPRLMTAYMLLIGSVILFFTSLVIEPGGVSRMSGKSPGVWALFFASAFLATALGQAAYNYGVGQIGPAEASVFMNLSPFFTLISSALFLRERISIFQIGGFIMILCGVILGSGLLEEYLGKRKRNFESEETIS